MFRQQPVEPVERGGVHPVLAVDHARHPRRQIIVRSRTGYGERGHRRVGARLVGDQEVRRDVKPVHDALPHLDRGDMPSTALNGGHLGLDEADAFTELRPAQSGELPVGAKDGTPVLGGDRRHQLRMGPQVRADFPHTSNIGRIHRALAWL
ncbi:hypothetical protein GCM10010389_06950 [Streptomyces echinoruber]|uniref:Uncharacterized protein n=1 Tax=Streptomyces echinoruber TaxID=68898 RepID=A0A918QVB2_9ACTN|nr:hypothetical protein GCM10010389_06950 [Streptomyces echinoruber]